MKSIKQKRNNHRPDFEDKDSVKPKKKIMAIDQKVNVKSNKFWEDIYEDEGDKIDKLLK